MSVRNRWSVFVLLMLFIYTTLPVMPRFMRYLESLHLRAAFLFLLFGAGISTWGFHLRKRYAHLLWSHYIIQIIVLGSIVLGMSQLENTNRWVHFLEYAVLGAIGFWCLQDVTTRNSALLFSVLLTGAVGWGDEWIQFFLPVRHYNIVDVLINAFSGFLGALLIHSGFPKVTMNGQ